MAWWQWALGIPEATNPVADTTGQFCDVGQSGPVWSLTGTFGSSVERTCTVPKGKSIFMPVYNWIFGAGVFDCEPTVPGVTCDVPELQAKAAAATEAAGLDDCRSGADLPASCPITGIAQLQFMPPTCAHASQRMLRSFTPNQLSFVKAGETCRCQSSSVNAPLTFVC